MAPRLQSVLAARSGPHGVVVPGSLPQIAWLQEVHQVHEIHEVPGRAALLDRLRIPRIAGVPKDQAGD